MTAVPGERGGDRLLLERGEGARGAIAGGRGPADGRGHYCIGAPLARLEVRVALTALLGRARRLERAWEKLDYNRTLTVRGPLAVPVRVTPG